VTAPSGSGAATRAAPEADASRIVLPRCACATRVHVPESQRGGTRVSPSTVKAGGVASLRGFDALGFLGAPCPLFAAPQRHMAPSSHNTVNSPISSLSLHWLTQTGGESKMKRMGAPAPSVGSSVSALGTVATAMRRPEPSPTESSPRTGRSPQRGSRLQKSADIGAPARPEKGSAPALLHLTPMLRLRIPLTKITFSFDHTDQIASFLLPRRVSCRRVTIGSHSEPLTLPKRAAATCSECLWLNVHLLALGVVLLLVSY